MDDYDIAGGADIDLFMLPFSLLLWYDFGTGDGGFLSFLFLFFCFF